MNYEIMVGEVFISAKCYSNEITRSFFLRGGKGIQFYDVCVFVTQPSFVFSSNLFFGGRGRGRWGPFLSDPFSYIIFIEISFDLFQKKAPPGRAVPLIK